MILLHNIIVPPDPILFQIPRFFGYGGITFSFFWNVFLGNAHKKACYSLKSSFTEILDLGYNSTESSVFIIDFRFNTINFAGPGKVRFNTTGGHSHFQEAKRDVRKVVKSSSGQNNFTYSKVQ